MPKCGKMDAKTLMVRNFRTILKVIIDRNLYVIAKDRYASSIVQYRRKLKNCGYGYPSSSLFWCIQLHGVGDFAAASFYFPFQRIRFWPGKIAWLLEVFGTLKTSLKGSRNFESGPVGTNNAFGSTLAAVGAAHCA